MNVRPLPAPGETFKQHPDHGHLLVSDHGRVFSLKARRLVGYLSGPSPTSPVNAYLRVRVAQTGPDQTKGVHHLVLETFIGPCPEDHQADHTDHDSLNNRLDNLAWRPAHDNLSDTTRRAA